MYVKIYLKPLLNERSAEMNFKDKGNKKWTSLMLTAHREKLRELKKREKNRKKTVLDDQEKAAINSKLQQALQNNLEVKIKYYEDKRYKTVIGVIETVDINRKELIIDERKIKFTNLLDVKLK